jgi:RecA-family ATPase
VEQGRALYLSAEDDIEELHRRLVDIANYDGTDLSEVKRLDILPLAGKDAVLAAPDPKTKLLTPTPLFASIKATIEAAKPTLTILDTSADLYGGDENVRPQVRQFVGMLRGLCIECRTAIVLLSHPSLTGINSGSGLSGSTAWNGSVRSRLYLDRMTERDGDRTVEPDPTLRVLKTMKANYAATDKDGIRLHWEAGVFKPAISGGGFAATAKRAQAERVFLRLTETFNRQRRRISPSRGGNFAPVLFARHPDSEGVSKSQFEASMNALLEAGTIEVEEIGPPSRRRQNIVIGGGK